MKKVILKPLQHRNTLCIAIYYQYDPFIDKLIRKLPARSWSRTHQCWYIPDAPGKLEALAYHLTSERIEVDQQHADKFHACLIGAFECRQCGSSLHDSAVRHPRTARRYRTLTPIN